MNLHHISVLPNGYQVRVTRSGEEHSKFHKKRIDAIRYRNNLLDKLPPPARPGESWGNTGVKGLHFAPRSYGSDLVVSWHDKRARQRTFSIAKYGKDEALRLAAETLSRVRGIDPESVIRLAGPVVDKLMRP